MVEPNFTVRGLGNQNHSSFSTQKLVNDSAKIGDGEISFEQPEYSTKSFHVMLKKIEEVSK
jgi:hypothetical protein